MSERIAAAASPGLMLGMRPRAQYDPDRGQHRDTRNPQQQPDAAVPGLAPAMPASAPAVFAVALLTGPLDTFPANEDEARRRFGGTELPMQGSLALTDKRV